MPGIDYRRDVLNPLVAALRQLDALPVDVMDASSRSDAVRHVRTMLTRDLASHYLDTPARSRVELMAAWLTAQNRTADARELRQRVRGLLRDVDAWARREAVATCEGELRRAEWDNVVVDARELAHRLELWADVPREPVVGVLKAAAADVRAGLADVRELWARELPGEPWPTTTEDWAALGVRAGVGADTILSGQWTWADVEPIALGYLRRLRDASPQRGGGDEVRDRVPPMRRGAGQLKPLSEHEVAAYNLSISMGWTQKQIAAELSKQFGRPFSQGWVSRMVKRATHIYASLGAHTDLPTPKIIAVDPEVLDMGRRVDPHAKHQRQAWSED